MLAASGCNFLINGLPIGGSDAAVTPDLGGTAPADLAVAPPTDMVSTTPFDLSPRPLTTLDLLAGSTGGYHDATGAAAQFNNPNGITSDEAGNVYVVDVSNDVIRMIDPHANVTTLAGQVGNSADVDGSGLQAGFDQPIAISYDGKGSLFITDIGQSTIRQLVISSAAVSTLIAPGVLNGPKGILADGAGHLYVSDAGNSLIRQITIATAQVTTVAGGMGQAGLMDGTGTGARFNDPRGLALDASGTLYVADGGNSAIRAIALSNGKVVTLSSTGFNFPRGLALDGMGTLFIADTQNSCIKRMSLQTHAVSVLAGVCGTAQQKTGPLPGLTAGPWGLTRLPDGSLVYSDVGTNDILVIH
jgi:DNA-binding beta-propeller fold protein YncE